MSHEHASPDEFRKSRKNLLSGSRIHHHLIGNGSQLSDSKRDRNFWIHKFREAIHDFSLSDFDGSDFNDPILERGKTGRLQVKNDILGILHPLPLLVCDDLFLIVHQVAFHPRYDLEEILPVRCLQSCLFCCFLCLFIEIFIHMIGIGQRLYHSMVGNSDPGHPPGIRPLNDVLDLRDPVHVAHLGMAVQLHPLIRRRIHSLYGEIRDLQDAGNGGDRHFLVKGVKTGNPFQLHKGSLFHLRLKFLILFFIHKDLDRNRVGKIGQVQNVEIFSGLGDAYVQGKNLSMDTDIHPRLRIQFTQRDDLSIEFFAIQERRICALWRLSPFSASPVSERRLCARPCLPAGSGRSRIILSFCLRTFSFSTLLCFLGRPLLSVPHFLPFLFPGIFRHRLRLFSLDIIGFNGAGQPAPLVQDPVQDETEFFAVAVSQDSFLQGHHHFLIRKRDLRIFKDRIKDRVVTFEFQQDTVLIGIKQILRRILRRKHKTFPNSDR